MAYVPPSKVYEMFPSTPSGLRSRGVPSLGQIYARLAPIRARTIAQLAEQFKAPPSHIRHKLHILLDKGLVERRLDPHNRHTHLYTRKDRKAK